MRILVTGGAGFIGSHLVARLAESGRHEVTVLDDLSTGVASNLAGVPGPLLTGDVSDPHVVEMAMRDGVDAVVHLAAQVSVPESVEDPRRTHVVNVTGTFNVLEAARRHGAHVVFASSSAVYGSTDRPINSESDPTVTMSPYAASKLAGESMALAYQHSYGLPVTACRFFNVYGARQRPDHPYAAVIPKWIDALTRGEAVRVFGDGLQTRDFTYVDDLCAAIERVVTGRIVHELPVNLAFGTQTSLQELAGVLGRVLGREVPITYAAARTADVRHSRADATSLRRLLPGLRPVALEEGLAVTAAWFEQAVAS